MPIPHLDSLSSKHYMDLVHYHDASPDFITDMLLYDQNDIKVKYMSTTGLLLSEKNLSVRLVVVAVKYETRNYNREPNHYNVCKMVLMDGSNSLISGVTDTSLHNLI